MAAASHVVADAARGVPPRLADPGERVRDPIHVLGPVANDHQTNGPLLHITLLDNPLRRLPHRLWLDCGIAPQLRGARGVLGHERAQPLRASYPSAVKARGPRNSVRRHASNEER